ncbi:hypothetical protein J5N97_010088 [Dioscorea zingiberensis]|uniref:Phytosulfokine n=1 Tax=Dioscorea zingiberensis TaxID=325984 RepID=A0A9D5D0M4_9LILI|nr:hypothetical protein J5N97_010088 [Dioscorea zingiberensis]
MDFSASFYLPRLWQRLACDHIGPSLNSLAGQGQSPPSAVFNAAENFLAFTHPPRTAVIVATVAVPSEPKTAEKEVVEDANIPEPMDERCEGVGDEECLLRRTLAAHIDYVYKQRKKP